MSYEPVQVHLPAPEGENGPAGMTARLRSTSFTRLCMDNAKALLGFGIGFILGLLFVYILAYRSVPTTASSDRNNESDEEIQLRLSKMSLVRTVRLEQLNACVPPPVPEHGVFTISHDPNATPGQAFEALVLQVNCSAGYRPSGADTVFCVNGTWSHSIPKCIRFCKLPTNPSVSYQCLVSGTNRCFRDCNTYEPSGTIVKPECNRPNYYSVDTVYYMRCDNGSWNRVVKCSPECGRVTPNGMSLIIGGRSAKRRELPWHVSIYWKKPRPYMQICGGSLVSNRVVLSGKCSHVFRCTLQAAHCFWNDVTKQQDPSKYAVGAGKIYRPWNNLRDRHAQKSDVKEIKIPVRFQGNAANFQDDIAVVILEITFEYTPYVRAICLDFDRNFDKLQLQPGKLGKVAGFGLVSEDGIKSQILKVAEMPYVSIEQCIALSPFEYREYITSDKICAGSKGTTLCKGDSGGGLAFINVDRGMGRYFIRGVASTAPNNGHACNVYALTAFTQITKHEDFIKESLIDV